jgi:hypothetical protein
MHSIDGIPMEDPNTPPDELTISEKGKAYLDRVIKLNTDAMGHREEWDAHGNAILDLVREVVGEMDTLRTAIAAAIDDIDHHDESGAYSTLKNAIKST